MSRASGMRRRAMLAVGAVALSAGIAACGSGGSGGDSGGSDSASSGDEKGPILIGISGAKTGALSPYDLQPGKAFQLKVDEINAAGGVMGRKLQVKWIDTKSDKTLSASNATQLL